MECLKRDVQIQFRSSNENDGKEGGIKGKLLLGRRGKRSCSRGDMVVQTDFFSLSNQDFAFRVICKTLHCNFKKVLYVVFDTCCHENNQRWLPNNLFKNRHPSKDNAHRTKLPFEL